MSIRLAGRVSRTLIHTHKVKTITPDRSYTWDMISLTHLKKKLQTTVVSEPRPSYLSQ